jgi:hypothetical protein
MSKSAGKHIDFSLNNFKLSSPMISETQIKAIANVILKACLVTNRGPKTSGRISNFRNFPCKPKCSQHPVKIDVY